MLPALVIEKLPRLIRAIKLMPGDANEEESAMLADELAGITAMVAEKFTNDRTAEGIQRALLLTVGGVSLGLEHAVKEQDDLADAEFSDDPDEEEPKVLQRSTKELLYRLRKQVPSVRATPRRGTRKSMGTDIFS